MQNIKFVFFSLIICLLLFNNKRIAEKSSLVNTKIAVAYKRRNDREIRCDGGRTPVTSRTIARA